MADGLLTTLTGLIKRGTVAWSKVSATQRKALRPLLDGGILIRERSGGGERLVVKNPAVVQRFADNCYPNGLVEATEAAQKPGRLSTTQGVHYFRDAKRGGQQADLLLFRGRPGTTIQCNDIDLPVGQLTSTAGVAAVVLNASQNLSMCGTLAIVENQTAFLHAETLGVNFDVALYGQGRLSRRVIDWLGSRAMEAVDVVHCPDYDPVGLDEYIRLHAQCGDRVRLHRPHNLEELLQRYGKPSLYLENQRLLASLEDAPPAAQSVAT
ncbi:MAG: hypothetical protein PPP56_01940, partial [Longimonas sp.]|uniref:hypothetical protein n=1 Tax=Longimonas sp. TaxID=2039626 RepID=UPI0033525B6C